MTAFHLQVARLIRRHGLTDTQAAALAEMIWGAS